MENNTQSPRKVALVVGAQGVIGRNLVDHLLTLHDWDVIGLSRRGGAAAGRLRHIAVDLLDATDSRLKLGGLSEVTHIFYTAYQDRPSWAELVPPNLAMLVNVVEAIEPVATGLRHISLMQGYKVYGAHLGPFKTPAKESDPNHMPPEFNIDQQNFLETRQQGKSWTWSATVWAATDARCANQAFNITNGDLFRWNDMWPKIAKWFELEVAPPLPMSLNVVMADKEPLWNAMKEKYGLQYDYSQVSSWIFGDFVFGWDYDMFGDGSKARRFGFHEFIDTEEMFLRIFGDFRAKKVIP